VGGRGSAPDPAAGSYSTPPDPLAQLRALLLKGREGGRRGREGAGREVERKWYPHFLGESYAPALSARPETTEFDGKPVG